VNTFINMHISADANYKVSAMSGIPPIPAGVLWIWRYRCCVL